jgi:hypothetical protein
MEQLTTKPFLQDTELQQMKRELSNLERQIAIKIQENQLKQHQQQEEPAVEAPVIKMVVKEANGYSKMKEAVMVTQEVVERPRSRMRL